MGLEAIGEIQSRINAIQQLVATPLDPVSAGSAATGAAGASSSAPLADPASFASVLAAVGQQQPGDGALAGASPDLASALGSLGDASAASAGTGGLASLLGGTTGGTAGLASLLGGTTGGTGGLASLLGGTTVGAPTTTPGGINGFVLDALEQAGKRYQYGATASPSDPSPPAFDCSELVQWSAARHGVALPRTAGEQYLAAKQGGDLVPVDVAMRTPGALLFSFSSEPVPGRGEPAHAHVAISLGDGRTIEARGKAYGVGTFSAANRFTYGAVIPGLAA